MEVTFKYSMVPTDIRPPKRMLDEMTATSSIGNQQTQQDSNPRPKKRRKNDVKEEVVVAEPEVVEEDTEEIEKNMATLTQLLSSCENLTSSTNSMERSLIESHFTDCGPMMDIIKAQLGMLQNKLKEKRSFYSLWVGSERPHNKNLNLGYYGLLPVELIYSIFRFVDGKELLILSQVCSLFHEIAQDESLWKGVAERLWPVSIALGQKPENRTWKWLFRAKTHTFRPDEERNGVGRFVLPYGNLYEGEWRNGKRHGQGTGIMKDGRRYDGQWENDMRYGFGIFRWPLDCGANGGDTYVGEWKDSKRHGQGVYTWFDGTKYDGQWGDGKREGMGCVVWPDGRRYVGEYKDGKMEGKGTFTWPDQSVYVGDYINGKRHGKGKYTYSNGGIYEGEWEGGMRHGKGTLWKSTGEKYEGQWRYNAPYGLGTVTYKDGRQVEKQWIEDELLITP